MDFARKIMDQIKRNGEFDKCRREVLAKVFESECMKRSIDHCQRLVRDVLRTAPQSASIANLRDMAKDEIRRRSLINPLLDRAEREFQEYESFSKLHQMIEDLTRSELGLPPPDTNIELVDMDVSSGASSSTSTLGSDSASVSRSTPEEADIKQTNGSVQVRRELTRSPTPPPPPSASNSASPPPPPPSRTPTEAPSASTENGGRGTKRKASPLADEADIKRAIKLEPHEPSPLSTANSSPRFAFVSRSPSIISDDPLQSLPPYPTTLSTPLEGIVKTESVAQLPLRPLHGHEASKIEAISESEESDADSVSKAMPNDDKIS